MIKRETPDNLADTASAISQLRGAFGRAAFDDMQTSLIHKIARAQENMILLSAGAETIAGVMERGAKLARTIGEVQEAVRAKSKQSFDTVMFLNLLDQHIADLESDIADIRSYFEDKYGDAWAEVLALSVLDEDEMPQREDDESLADYRERSEKAVVEKMTDENGNIKPEYADHPDAEHIERLAKKTRNLDEAKELNSDVQVIANNPDLSRSEQIEQIEGRIADSDFEGKAALQGQATVGSVQDVAVFNSTDEEYDTKLASGAATSLDNAFIGG